VPSEPPPNPEPGTRASLWAHILLLVAVSAAYESLFLHHGIAWLFDEGWPLYAAKRLHEGGTLYRDVFFSFPPGHLLPAWVAYGLDPPGVVSARIIYAGFNVALCLAFYLLGRRLMSPRFALLGALALALAAPRSHLAHLLFGYRYLVFSVLSLLAFSARLQTERSRWMVAAGLSTGIALYFRLTPAFAVSCGLAVAVMAAQPGWRGWLRDWSYFGVGLLLIAVPLVSWFANSVGLETLWRELVVRVVGLQQLQSLPIPQFAVPSAWNRVAIYKCFVPVQYWISMAIYCGYALGLGFHWYRCVSKRQPFRHSLLLAVVIWGGVYFLRTLGRSDEHHLASAIPPVCLLVAHLGSLCFRALWPLTASDSRWRRNAAEGLVCLAAVASWVFLQGTDLYFATEARGVHPIRSLNDEVFIRSSRKAARVDWQVQTIIQSTRPDDTLLDLTNAPLIHVLSGRNGPGYLDVVTPGVFMSRTEERAFVERLERSPPALVLWPRRDFDRMASRSVTRTAPLVSDWVKKHYREPDPRRRRLLLVPRKSGSD
jgi:4-amino-4-deoxy-L-arabinose transferase-like glycosyltransferase